LDYTSPERVAKSFHDQDFAGASHSVKTSSTDWEQVEECRWERTDDWGNTWARIDPTSMGEVVRGVLDDISEMDRYEFPDFSNPADYEDVRKARLENPEKWLIGGIPGFAFNIARKLRKLENYLSDLLTDRDRIGELHDRIDVFLDDMIRNYAAAGVDSVMFCEDWGTQNQTLISPRLWHEEFFPRFVQHCTLAHDLGIRVFMHSCGQIEAIVPGLIEAGIDLLQFDQPDLHQIDVLASHQENAKITFWCPVDIQKVLPTGNEQLIRAKARELLDKVWKGRGGFVAGYYGDNVSIGLDPDWQEYACDEFVRHGVSATYNLRKDQNS
jgi:uroporphyrinogen decarboxylase